MLISQNDFYANKYSIIISQMYISISQILITVQ